MEAVWPLPKLQGQLIPIQVWGHWLWSQTYELPWSLCDVWARHPQLPRSSLALCRLWRSAQKRDLRCPLWTDSRSSIPVGRRSHFLHPGADFYRSARLPRLPLAYLRDLWVYLRAPAVYSSWKQTWNRGTVGFSWDCLGVSSKQLWQTMDLQPRWRRLLWPQDWRLGLWCSKAKEPVRNYPSWLLAAYSLQPPVPKWDCCRGASSSSQQQGWRKESRTGFSSFSSRWKRWTKVHLARNATQAWLPQTSNDSQSYSWFSWALHSNPNWAFGWQVAFLAFTSIDHYLPNFRKGFELLSVRLPILPQAWLRGWTWQLQWTD